AAADTQAAAGHNVPRRVKLQVNGNVNHDAGEQGQGQSRNRQNRTPRGRRDGDRGPGGQDHGIDQNRSDPEKELEVAQKALRGAEGVQRFAGRHRQRRWAIWNFEPAHQDRPDAAIDPAAGALDVTARARCHAFLAAASAFTASRISWSRTSAWSPGAEDLSS